MPGALTPWLAVLLVLAGGGLGLYCYGRHQGAAREQLEQELEAAIAQDSATRGAALRADVIMRDSITRLAARLAGTVATARAAAGQLRATLDAGQQRALEALEATWTLALAIADSQTTAERGRAAFWQAQAQALGDTVTALRQQLATARRRPRRCGLLVGAGVQGGIGAVAAGTALAIGPGVGLGLLAGLGCRL